MFTKNPCSITLCCIYNWCFQREAKGSSKANPFLHRATVVHDECCLSLMCCIAFLFACPFVVLYLPFVAMDKKTGRWSAEQDVFFCLIDGAAHQNDKPSHMGGFCKQRRWALLMWAGDRVSKWNKFNTDSILGFKGTLCESNMKKYFWQYYLYDHWSVITGICSGSK